MLQYNLTTKEGIQKAKESLTFVNPVASFLIKIAEKVLKSDNSKEQAQLAEELIKQGKKNKVDEMEITLSNTKGVDV